jgi:hypothetical protein
MTDTTLLTETLRDWSQEVDVPHDLAARTLAGRRQVRRRRTVPLLAGIATAAAVAVAVATTGSWGSPGDAARHTAPPAKDGLSVSADTSHNPPQDLVSAGDLAVSAVMTFERVATGDGWQTLRRHYSLLNTTTGRYEPSEWTWVSVAPGLETAAVLEGDLPSSRIGLVDLATGEVTRWIPVDHPVGSLVWSPDGSRLLATTYDSDPDLEKQTGPNTFKVGSGGRTGFLVVDPTTGTSDWSATGSDPFGGRSDLHWTHDGTAVFDTVSGEPDKRWFHLDGSQAESRDLSSYQLNLGPVVDIPLTSPDGRFTITQSSGLPTAITDNRSGTVYRQDALQVLGWADDEHVVTLAGCSAPCRGTAEFRNGLVLMRYDGTDPVALTGTRKGDDSDWEVELTPR